MVVWLIRLRALLGRPCDPVAVLPLDAEPRVVEVCRQIREVDDALEYHLLIQEQRAEDEAREAEERAREAELEAREAKEAKEAKAQRSQPRAPSPEETLARARRLSDEEDARDLARFWAGLDE